MERVRRRWWTAAVTLGAVVVVLGALSTAVFQVVMQIAPGYRQDLADYVSRVARQPVDIGGVGLGWSGLAPRLDLTDITLYGEDERTPALSAERLRLGFAMTRLIRGDTTPERVELAGLELFAQIDADGTFSLRGLDTSGMPSRATQDWLRQLSRFQSVRLSRCELILDDARLKGLQPRFRLIDAEIEFEDGRGEATAEWMLPAEIGSQVQLEAEIVGDLQDPASWNGRWSAQVEKLAGVPWLQARLADDARVGFRETELNLEGVLKAGSIGVIDLRLDAGAVVGRRVRTRRSCATVSWRRD
ncbi:MAG: YhdP family protein [Panacagrimonas sp.]